MKNYLCAALGLLLILSSCRQQDQFTGVWNKNTNPELDQAAFPTWQDRGKRMVDAGRVGSPLFIRIKKEMGYYVMNCYQFDAPSHNIVADPTIFDYVKLKKADDNTLVSDNKASNIITEKMIVLHVDPTTHEMTMLFEIPKAEMPQDKHANALFRTMFGSGYHKLIEIRRKTADPDLINSKLKSEGLIK